MVPLYQGKTKGDPTEDRRKETVDCKVLYSPDDPNQQVVHIEEEEMSGDDTS